MGGIFGVADKENCAKSLIHGTDFNTHMLDQGFVGMGVNGKRPEIHRGGDVKEKFSEMQADLEEDDRQYGIGVLSDHEHPLTNDLVVNVYADRGGGRFEQGFKEVAEIIVR